MCWLYDIHKTAAMFFWIISQFKKKKSFQIYIKSSLEMQMLSNINKELSWRHWIVMTFHLHLQIKCFSPL